MAERDIEWARWTAISGRAVRRVVLWAAGAVLLAVVLYYPIGMIVVHEIDDDTAFAVAESGIPPGGSRAVSIAAALIDREVNQHEWVANDPIFMPGAFLDNMQNFQQGVIGALARFSFELVDQLGRTRGSSQIDPDLQEAAGLLQYSGKKWVFDFATSIAPTATSEAQYRRAMRALLDYNRRLGRGDAVFERRADNLLATLDRIAADLGSASAAIDKQIAVGRGGFFDTDADDVFYTVKGQAYAYYLLLREMRADFDNVVIGRELTTAWEQMLTTMHEAARLNAWVIANGDPNSMLVPSHLAAQGFFVLRARTQLREITAILQK
ncbi:MAG: DUF2333 family protein [Alphaproteobacteria bacterium]|nr:DUF2333 family protein [Alphaproteobacteria bacterium]